MVNAITRFHVSAELLYLLYPVTFGENLTTRLARSDCRGVNTGQAAPGQQASHM